MRFTDRIYVLEGLDFGVLNAAVASLFAAPRLCPSSVDEMILSAASSISIDLESADGLLASRMKLADMY
jgi:hypothetical protein